MAIKKINLCHVLNIINNINEIDINQISPLFFAKFHDYKQHVFLLNCIIVILSEVMTLNICSSFIFILIFSKDGSLLSKLINHIKIL